MAETRPQTGGVTGDLHRLKSDGGATVAELREFLGQMRGRSPQEMIGLVARSGLTRSMFLATFLFLLLLAALTVVPYALNQRAAEATTPVAKQDADAKQEHAEPSPPAETGAKADAEPSSETTAAAPAAEPQSAGADAERAVDAMGIGETRVAPADKNPLEDKLDKLLDGVD